MKIFLCIVLQNGLEDISCPSTLLPPRLDRRVLVVAPMTFMMTQQRTRTICNSTLIAIFAHLEIIERANQMARCEILSFHWTRETVLIEVIIVRPNSNVNFSEQFTFRECMRPSFEGSVNMDL